MDFFGLVQPYWKVFSDNILTRPEYFIGLVVMLGYILLKKSPPQVFAGTMKAVVGIMIWNVGAGGLVGTFRPILAGLNDRFALKAAVIDPYFGLAAANKGLEGMATGLVSWVMIVLLIGFLWNLVLILFRKFTKCRTQFLTGHILLQQATTATFLIFFALPEMRDVQGALLTGLLVGTYWAVFSNLTVEATNNLTDNAGFAVGHQQMLAVWVTDKVAGKIGNKDKNLDNVKLPKFLDIFQDNVVTTGTLMLLFFGIIMMILGSDYLRNLDKANFPATLSFAAYIINRSLHFAVYLFVLLSGVRMFVAELQESFRGISERLLPGSMPAVDCAATYGYAPPNAVVWGFLFGAIGQFIAIAGLIVFQSPIMIITGFVPVFFDNATIAVFANKRGGIRAATILPVICGILQVLGGGFAAWYFGLYQFGGWHGNIDWDTIWPAFGYIVNIIKMPSIPILIILMLIIPQLQYLRTKNKKEYFKVY
jgi:ascorbate PTS system EIIC component